MKEYMQRYAELMFEQRKINAEMEQLKSKFRDAMEDADVEVMESEFGSVTVCKRRKYLYPQEIQDAELQVSKMKEEAEKVGTASYSESEYLRFDMPKK
jgi:hypothetical protein